MTVLVKDETWPILIHESHLPSKVNNLLRKQETPFLICHSPKGIHLVRVDFSPQVFETDAGYRLLRHIMVLVDFSRCDDPCSFKTSICRLNEQKLKLVLYQLNKRRKYLKVERGPSDEHTIFLVEERKEGGTRRILLENYNGCALYDKCIVPGCSLRRWCL